MPNNYFQFKQFTVQQDNCAMKVCTDACLFGALTAAHVQQEINCLDIGTGTGLLSLMLAQKNATMIIDAVEIDAAAAAQASANMAASPWASRIHVFNEDISAFDPGKKYDCIISNPPFFENDLRSADMAKNNAKHHTSLSLTGLLKVVDKQLAINGFFAVLLPYHRVAFFITEATKAGLHLHKQLLVKQTLNHDLFRGILFFKRTGCVPGNEVIGIKNNENQYTPEFTAALKDYYLYL